MRPLPEEKCTGKAVSHTGTAALVGIQTVLPAGPGKKKNGLHTLEYPQRGTNAPPRPEASC